MKFSETILKKLHMTCYEEMKQEIQIENYEGWEVEWPTLQRVGSKCFIERVIFKLRLNNEKELAKEETKRRISQAEGTTYAKTWHVEELKAGMVRARFARRLTPNNVGEIGRVKVIRCYITCMKQPGFN